MSLIVWCPLISDLHNQGISSTNLSGGGSFASSGGKIGSGCFHLTTGGTWVTISQLVDKQAFSICCWVKIVTSETFVNWADCWTVEANADGLVLPCRLERANTSSTTNLGWYVARKNNSAPYYNIGSTTSNGVWVHTVLTYDGTNAKSYANGTLVTTVAKSSFATSFKLTGRVRLGDSNSATYLNDFRIYDKALSETEIKELAKGLVAHYTLGSTDVYEATTNRFTYPTPGSAVGAVGWNQSLHPNAITVAGWSYGYNSGVTDASTVYHAMWNVIEGVPTMVFLDLNSTKGHTHSWLGISGGTTDASLFTSGRKYTVSFTAKSSVNGGAISCGLYYKRTSSESYSFYDGDILTNLTTTWKRYSITYTSQGANAITGGFYFYGHKGNEGIKYVRDVLLEFLDHATPYTPSSRSTGIVYDSSGYCRNGTISGTISPADSVRYDKSIYMDGTSAINIGNLATYVPDGNFTFNIWFYKDGYSSKGYDTIFGGPSGFEIETKPHYSGEPDYHICPHNWGSDHTTNTEIPYELNKWYMLTMVRTSSNTKWYLNGELNKTLNAGSIPSGNYFIGAWNSASQQNFKGRVSDCRIFATALSADDVTALYKLGLV